MPRENYNSVKEHWAFYPRTDQTNTKLAIFVHGFRGDYLNTWGALAPYLQNSTDTDADLQSWDFVFRGYDTGDVSSYLDIASLICGDWRMASDGESPYDRKYQKLALVGHSLGTLGIRQALCASSEHGQMLAALHSVTLFGSPLNGSKLASFGFAYKIAEALKPANPQLRMLRVWSEGAHRQTPWPPVRVITGQGDWVVGHEFAELAKWPGDKTPYATTLDHSDLAKPADFATSAVMNHIRTALR